MEKVHERIYICIIRHMKDKMLKGLKPTEIVHKEQKKSNNKSEKN